ncbi:flagellin [Sulfitobacter sp. HNIBRBA2951]|uniref:flagellin n=1 Tax=Sulfitobacter aquimarinus TaxID=3158557 RepID=UPI0032DEE1E1
MNFGSLSDLSRSYSMQSRNASLKADIQRLTVELASGQTENVRDAVGNNSSYISDLERSLTKLDGYELATLETRQFATSAQTALSFISDLNIGFSSTMLGTTNSALGETTDAAVNQAQTSLDDVIGALNTDVAGRRLFSGVATDTAPIASSDDLLAGLRAAMTGAGTVDDMLAAADAWFADPAGFGTTGYLGSDTSMAPVALSDEDSAAFTLRADEPALRDVLRNMAVAALTTDPALALTEAQQSELLQKTSDDVLSSTEALIGLQTETGFLEAKLETTTVRQGAERASLEIARSDLLSVDPYKAATELEQVQFQLQSLYAITSRMQSLSLVNYL